MKIGQVYARQAGTTLKTLRTKRRIIAAIDMMNGNVKKAKVNLDIDFDYTLNTYKSYWSEYNKLDAVEKKRFRTGNIEKVLVDINSYAALKRGKLI